MLDLFIESINCRNAFKIGTADLKVRATGCYFVLFCVILRQVAPTAYC